MQTTGKSVILHVYILKCRLTASRMVAVCFCYKT